MSRVLVGGEGPSLRSAGDPGESVLPLLSPLECRPLLLTPHGYVDRTAVHHLLLLFLLLCPLPTRGLDEGKKLSYRYMST